MTTRATRKIARDVNDAAGDIQNVIQKAGRRIGYEAKDALTETGARVGLVARAAAAKAGKQSRVIATRAVNEAKARPFAAAAIIATVGALIGAVLARGVRRHV